MQAKIVQPHLLFGAVSDVLRGRMVFGSFRKSIVSYLQSPEANVVSIQSRSRSKWRPLPLDTVVSNCCVSKVVMYMRLCATQELEKLASRKLRISAHETMRIAEKLYTQG